MDERNRRVAARFEQPLLVAAVLTIPVTIVQLLPAGDPWRTMADVLNWGIWLAFAAEVVVMLAATPARWRWAREHPLEITIVLLTPPFLTSVIQSVRVLRVLRLARLLRLAPLLRVLFSTEGVRFAALVALLTALGGGLTFASVERIPVGNGIYWAITTMTTVGYGDITPKTSEGKGIAVAVMLVGIGFATLVIGAMAERFVHPEVQEVEVAEEDLVAQVRDIGARLARLEAALQERARSG